MRPRFSSLNFLAKILLKPRFGRRRCSGIWPPSKPLIRTPLRAVWPFPPRPPVLPIPEPMPRPMRKRFLRDPGRSANSLSFMFEPSRLVDDADEVLDLFDHPADLRRVFQRARAANLVE